MPTRLSVRRSRVSSHTFLIWVMVIVGGSGNNWGAVLGGS
jgi:ABC-type branched-subunit amino acid transport system permease subunit